MADQLQHLTELLAATHTQEEVLAAALSPALLALSAVAGAVLLLDVQRQCLRLAALQGDQAQTVWQAGPFSPETPAGDALIHRQPLYFEHAGALTAAYPELESHTGGLASVATAVLPLLLDDQALGVLILDFREPHTFTSEERRFLTILARQTSLALDRADLLQQREAEAAQFRRMVETSPTSMAVGSLDGRLTLVNDAYLHLLGFTRSEFEAGQIDWQALTPEDYRAQDQQAFEAAFSQGVSTTYEKEMLNKAGERLPLKLTLIRHDAQQVVGYLQDLRVQKAQEQVVAGQATTIQEGKAASQAFVQFTEAASHTSDVDQLARLALDTLQAVLPGSSAVFYTLQDQRWRVRQFTADLQQELLSVLEDGLPLETPALAQLAQSRAPVFIDGWTVQEYQVEHTGQFQTVALYPVVQNGEVCAALTVALQELPAWSEWHRSLISAVGRSFSLLYERVSIAEQLRHQRTEAERRSEVLEAFASLTAELNVRQRPYELIMRAQEIVLSLLPDGHALYWEPVEGRWRCLAQTGEVGNPELQAAIDAGFPVGQLPTIDGPWHSGEPEYQDRYLKNRDRVAALTGHIQAVAALPIFQGESLRGVMNFTLTEPHIWRAVDQVVLETVQQSLSLALDRLQQQHVIQQQWDEAESRSRALEAFAVMSRDLADETDRYALVRRAQEIMLALLTPGYALYWEAAGDHWTLRSQMGDIGDPALQQLVDEQGLPLDTPALYSTWLTGTPNYQDNYAQGADTPAEMIRHVQAATAFRVQMHGQPIGMLAIGLFDQRTWTPMDKAVLETAIYSLGLVLERAQSIEALAQVNSDLQAANEELEAFTYSASHDLRTPVRHIMSFTELARKALADVPNVKVERYLGVVEHAALRMTALIDGMLLLSRSGRLDLHLQPVDLNLLAAQARRDAMEAVGSHAVRWQVGTLPRVQGDHSLLQQVMTNLLSNAVKYSAKREVSEIKVWAQLNALEWTISVQDNGVGFPTDYAQKLFRIFQRLHTEKEFEGTGVGLATVKRIVQRHGGRVFAESDGEHGATFGFTLPKLG